MFLKLYCIALPIFFAMDMVWLGVAAKKFYARQIGFPMNANVNCIIAMPGHTQLSNDTTNEQPVILIDNLDDGSITSG